MAHSRQKRNAARELFIIEGLSYEQVAGRTKIPIGTLKRWGDEEHWDQKREEYQADREGFKKSLSGLRDRMLTKALGSLDPQDVYPLVALEKLLTARMQPGEPPGQEDAMEKKMSPEELLTFIKEKIYGLAG